MAYQISLTLAGDPTTYQFESFSFTDAVLVLEQKIFGKNGETIIHIPGQEGVTVLTLTHPVDSTSAKLHSLYRAVTDGHVAKVRGAMILSFSDAGGSYFPLYEFESAFVCSIATSGNRHGGTGPEEQIQIAYDAVQFVAASAPLR